MQKGQDKSFEARAESLSPRGEPYRYFGVEFPPEKWVEISSLDKARLQFKSSLKFRPKSKSAKGEE